MDSPSPVVVGRWLLVTKVWSEEKWSGPAVITSIFSFFGQCSFLHRQLLYLRCVKMPPYSEFIVFTDSKGGFEKILLLRNWSLITNSYIDLIMHILGLGEDSQLEFGYIDSCFNFIGCSRNPPSGKLICFI